MAELTTIPTQYGFADQGFLAAGLKPGVTTCQISPIYRVENGVRTPRGFNTPAAFVFIELAGEYERASYGALSVDPVTKITTLTDMRRELSQTDGNDFTSQGDGGDWPKGARVVVSNDPALFGAYALTGAENTFNPKQTFSRIAFTTDGDEYFQFPSLTTTERDALTPANGMVVYNETTSQLNRYIGGAWGPVENATSQTTVKVSSNDTTADFLINKLAAGANITITETDDASDESVTIAVTGISASPAGSMTAFAGGSAPSGWLFTYGQAVSRTTYADLFAVRSTTYGVGDGSTTFNLPDMRGRSAIGLDNMGGSSADIVTATEADTLGGVSGSEKRSLAHTHTVAGVGNIADNGAGKFMLASTSVTTSSGGSATQDFMNPYMALNYIIKT